MRTEARKLQAKLQMIKDNKPVFYNVAQFLNLGLVEWKGGKVGADLILTTKAKSFLEVMV
jgi:hypothetical protein